MKLSSLEIFIKKPVYAIVLSMVIFFLGVRSIGVLPIQQFPTVESAIISVQTIFMGANPDTIAAFITTPLEDAVAETNGIDYLTSASSENYSTIVANLILNYDSHKALSEINTQVNSVINKLPTGALNPSVTLSVSQSINAMYIGFYSDVLPTNKVTDYVLRVIQPKLQALNGVQLAQILGGREYALRVWLDPQKLAGYNLTPYDISKVITENNFVAAAGRTDGPEFTLNFMVNSLGKSVDDFKNMIIRAGNNAVIRLKDVARVSLGAENYNTQVKFNGKSAVYVGIVVAPDANLLSVVNSVKKEFSKLQKQLPSQLDGNIVYDASKFVHASIIEVVETLFEAFIIVTIIIFLSLATIRALIIPTIAIPLSVLGTFFMMFVFGYSINLLTLLALVLCIGLVVDDAIIVVENVFRHIQEGKTPLEAAYLSVHELTQPIIAITIVLIAVYLPIGFLTGLTGALFKEFAFTLAGAVTVSAVIALTLSPMMCAKILRPENKSKPKRFVNFVDKIFNGMRDFYIRILKDMLNYLPVVIVFAALILVSNYFLFTMSKRQLAPQEDQGVILALVSASANSTLSQTEIYSNLVANVYKSYPQTEHTFEINGSGGANASSSLNASIDGMVLAPWNKRNKTTNQLLPLIQAQLNQIAGAKVAAFQPPSLPGGGGGLPIQFVVQTTENSIQLNKVAQKVMNQAYQTGEFAYIDSNLKVDKQQSQININRDKIAEFGLNMQDVAQSVRSALSEAYVNFFDYYGRAYEVIPQMQSNTRIKASDILNYYVTNSSGDPIQLSNIASLSYNVVPQSINHFQRLNSATISAVAAPGVTISQALATLKNIATKILPTEYSIDYGGVSRQFMQEKSALIVTFFFALIIIFLALAVLFNSFMDPLIVLISVPMSICGAMIFISLGVGGSSLNVFSQVGLVTLIGLIAKHGILIVQFANDEQMAGVSKREAIERASAVRFRPILMTTVSMVVGVIPLILATGAGAVSRFNIGLVIATGIGIGTLFTLFVVPSMYLWLATDFSKKPH